MSCRTPWHCSIVVRYSGRLLLATRILMTSATTIYGYDLSAIFMAQLVRRGHSDLSSGREASPCPRLYPLYKQDTHGSDFALASTCKVRLHRLQQSVCRLAQAQHALLHVHPTCISMANSRDDHTKSQRAPSLAHSIYCTRKCCCRPGPHFRRRCLPAGPGQQQWTPPLR